MPSEILQSLLSDVKNADTETDPEHGFADLISIASSFSDDLGEDGLRDLIKAGANHFGFSGGIKFRKEIDLHDQVTDIQPVLDELGISFNK